MDFNRAGLFTRLTGNLLTGGRSLQHANLERLDDMTDAQYNAAEIKAGRLTTAHQKILATVPGATLEARVANWQANHGLAVDGRAGPRTRATLVPVAKGRGQVIPLTAQDAVARALSLVGSPIIYRLGTGGRNPSAATPGSTCDCSGFVMWALGADRLLDGDYFGTDKIEADATGPQTRFARREYPQPADLVVYGAGPKIGHVGIVVGTGADPWVVDCAGGKRTPAIDKVRRASFWLSRGGIIARPLWLLA